MHIVMSDEYMSVAGAAREIDDPNISEARIRYWLLRDPRFPQGRRAGKPVVKPSAVVEYFRRLDEVQEVSGPLGDDNEGANGGK